MVSGERRTILNGTSLGGETCCGTEQLRSWRGRRTAAKAVAFMVPSCPMESVAPADMRSLTWWLSARLRSVDPAEKNSKPLAAGLADVVSEKE